MNGENMDDNDKIKEDQIEQCFQRLDVNGDGTIS